MSDLISRQAAIDALDERFDDMPMEQTTEILLLRRDLKELPSAQPKISIEIDEILDYLDEKSSSLIAAGHYDIYSELHDMISRLLFAQPDVIRCRDCKYGEVYDEDFPDQYFCHASGQDWHEGDYFCSNAETQEEQAHHSK